MPEGPDGKTIIIVKKVTGHGGHHGGSWKVAYADLVTSLMALFLVLWLVSAASSSARERIASYFRRPGIFEMGSGSPLEVGGAGLLEESFNPGEEKSARKEVTRLIYEGEDDQEEQKAGIDRFPRVEEGQEELETADREASVAKLAEVAAFEDVAEEILEFIETSPELVEQVDIKLDEYGLHIEIMDTEKESMFATGSAYMLPVARDKLFSIAKLIKSLPNQLDVEGHTDAIPFSDARVRTYDNWDLSTDRANAARRVLEEAGIEPSQIARVIGYAAKHPKVTAAPKDAANRRITISAVFRDVTRDRIPVRGADFLQGQNAGDPKSTLSAKAALARALRAARQRAIEKRTTEDRQPEPPRPSSKTPTASSTGEDNTSVDISSSSSKNTLADIKSTPTPTEPEARKTPPSANQPRTLPGVWPGDKGWKSPFELPSNF